MTKQKNRLQNFIKKQDMYGVPINLTYKNDNTYKTIQGGIVTMISRMIIVAFLLLHVKDLARRKNEIKRKAVYKDLVNDQEPYIMNTSTFDIALFVNYYGENPEFTENPFRYIDIKFDKVKLYFDTTEETPTQKYEYTNIPTIECDDTRFPTVKDQAEVIGIFKGYFCPKDIDFTLKGSQSSDELLFM